MPIDARNAVYISNKGCAKCTLIHDAELQRMFHKKANPICCSLILPMILIATTATTTNKKCVILIKENMHDLTTSTCQGKDFSCDGAGRNSYHAKQMMTNISNSGCESCSE